MPTHSTVYPWKQKCISPINSNTAEPKPLIFLWPPIFVAAGMPEKCDDMSSSWSVKNIQEKKAAENSRIKLAKQWTLSCFYLDVCRETCQYKQFPLWRSTMPTTTFTQRTSSVYKLLDSPNWFLINPSGSALGGSASEPTQHSRRHPRIPTPRLFIYWRFGLHSLFIWLLQPSLFLPLF